MTHWEHLSTYADLAHATILDLGSGRGGFLIEAAKRGAHATGLEVNTAYIALAQERAHAAGVSIAVVEGRAEALPFADSSFDFINVCEVIEHVDDPLQMLKEARRVLKPQGTIYLSAPNRFGLRDQHFHLYLVNWLPRAWSDAYISFFGTHKNYHDTSAGRQRLRDMHYYTRKQLQRLAMEAGFALADARQIRIERDFKGIRSWALRMQYPLARIIYFDSFHVLLTRTV